MLSQEALNTFGADYKKGMERCMNMEAFYFRMIRMAAADQGYDKLDAAVRAGDLKAGFEAAHALKGVLGNLELTALYVPVSAVTELLRKEEPADYAPYLEEILKKRDELKALCEL